MKIYRIFFLLVLQIVITKAISAQWSQMGPQGGSIWSVYTTETHLFAGSSCGSFRSSNNGDNWTKIQDVGITGYLQQGSFLFAIGSNSGVFRSTNNGDNWTSINNGLSGVSGGYCIVASDNTLFIGTAGGQGIYRSSDYGSTWTASGNGLTTNKFVNTLLNTGTTLFAGTNVGLYRSTDNGEYWAEVSVGLQNKTIHHIISSGPNLFAATEQGVHISTNNGDTWTQVINGLDPIKLQSVALLASGNTIFAGTAGGIFATTNNGTNWTNKNFLVTTWAFGAFGSIIFAGTAGGGVFRTIDFGQSWIKVMNDFNCAEIYAQAVSGTKLYAGTTGGGIYFSNNLGSAWIDISPGYDRMPSNIRSLALSSEFLFAGTEGSGILRSNDNGESWAFVNTGLGSLDVRSILVNDTLLFAGIWGGGVYRSSNNGDNWTSVNSGLTNLNLSSLFIDDKNLWAATQNGPYLSTNFGGSWVQRGLTTAGLRAFTLIENTLFTARYGLGLVGVYRTTNNGLIWEEAASGMNNGNVNALISFEGNLIAGTFSSGVFVSTNFGASWASVNTGLLNSHVRSLSIAGQYIFAGTAARGLFRRPLLDVLPGLLPATPSNLIAVADTHFVTLSWTDNSVNETGFKIERKNDSLHIGGTWAVIDSVGENITQYINSGLTPYKTYSYRIYAYNSLGKSPYSNFVETITIIPVELTSFTASVQEKNVLLNWNTATETNNRGFEVQRSETKGEWMSIGFVAGNGTTTEPKNYSFTDNNITTGKYAYRLQQIDYDGTFEYSNVIEIDVSITPQVFSLEQNYPNPFNPVTTISYTLPSESYVTVSIYSLTGEKVAELVNSVKQAGYHATSWEAVNFSTGMYFYTLNANSIDGKDFHSVKKMLFVK
jgi:photosystem II stability/assembly factor-like uncharacterized protein